MAHSSFALCIHLSGAHRPSFNLANAGETSDDNENAIIAEQSATIISMHLPLASNQRRAVAIRRPRGCGRLAPTTYPWWKSRRRGLALRRWLFLRAFRNARRPAKVAASLAGIRPASFLRAASGERRTPIIWPAVRPGSSGSRRPGRQLVAWRCCVGRGSQLEEENYAHVFGCLLIRQKQFGRCASNRLLHRRRRRATLAPHRDSIGSRSASWTQALG